MPSNENKVIDKNLNIKFGDKLNKEQIEKISYNAAMNMIEHKRVFMPTQHVSIPQSNLDVGSFVEEENKRYLSDAVTIEVAKNEEKKRLHKDKLLKSVTWFLGIQFGLFFILLSGVIVMTIVAHMINNPFEADLRDAIFDLLKIYLTSIIVEMISMLYFIVRNVFDTTIPELAKIIAGNEQSAKNANENNKWIFNIVHTSKELSSAMIQWEYYNTEGGV